MYSSEGALTLYDLESQGWLVRCPFPGEKEDVVAVAEKDGEVYQISNIAERGFYRLYDQYGIQRQINGQTKVKITSEEKAKLDYMKEKIQYDKNT